MDFIFFNFIFLIFLLEYVACNLCRNEELYDTIVVGLGAAGCTAASTLAKAGRKVLALEAQNRIGGRIWTVPFGDGVVELGAEWIHGTEQSRVYETAVKYDINVLAQDDTYKVIESDGTKDKTRLVEELIEYLFRALDHPPEKPAQLGYFLTKRLKKYLRKKYPRVLKDKAFVNEFLELMNFIINSWHASNDWNDISAQFDYEELEGNLRISWHRYGYRTFLELLLNIYSNSTGWPTLDIELNKEVTLIKWPKDRIGYVEVTCKDGSVYKANNVLVTVSLGVLKERYSSLFSPPIPYSKETVINMLSIGHVGKTIFSFREAWWPVNVEGFYLFWYPKDKKQYKEYPWIIELKELYVPMGSSNTMTVWANGDTAKLIEILPEEDVKSKMLEVMQKFLGRNETIPEPTEMIRSKWFSNPFTRGSYTYDNLLKHEYPYAREILGEPLYDAAGNPKVLFAGEATDSIFYSTVHGASESGFREASRLLDRR